jgi:protein-disulfide isomerase
MFAKIALALVATAGAVVTVQLVRGHATVDPARLPSVANAVSAAPSVAPAPGPSDPAADRAAAAPRVAPAHRALPPPPAHLAAPAAPSGCASGQCQPAPEQPSHLELAPDGAPAMGPAGARVTIVELVDFQCPFCERAVATVHDLAALYPDDVRIVVKNMPLPGHARARDAAIAAAAAQRQGRYWEMHEMLFSNQDRLDAAGLRAAAQHLGLDLARFDADVADPAVAAAVDADLAEATAAGVRGVPTFAINGRVVVGMRPLAELRAIVDEELAR